MRVEVHAADLGGCGHYRMIWPAQAASAAGIDVQLRTSEAEGVNIPTLFQDGPDGPHVIDFGPYDWPDVLVVQRPIKREVAEAIPMIQARGVAVAVEIDDNFSRIHPQNIAFKRAHPRYSPMRNYKWLEAACAQADLVICTTEALARQYARHGRVRVIPNYVPERYLKIEVPDYAGVMGWSGAIQTHPGDLESARGFIGRAMDQLGMQFGVVGTGQGVARRLAINTEVQALGWLPLADYPTGMAQLDVTVVPLAISDFNQSKSWLKGLEAAAVGSSAVATATEPYARLQELGLCRTVKSPKDWIPALRAAVADVAEDRQAFAEKSRATIRSKRLTIEQRVDDWNEAWKQALEERSRAR